MGVGNLAPVVDNTTSETSCNPFRRGSKTFRTPPKSNNTEVPNQIPEARLNARRNILAPQTKHVETESHLIDDDIQKLFDILNTMKGACGKQKNISMDIKNGILKIEEFLDKIKWNKISKKKSVQNAETQTTHDKGENEIAIERMGDSRVSPNYGKETLTTKRLPSSPLKSSSHKRKRKSQRETETTENEKTQNPTMVIMQESYAEKLKQNEETGTPKPTHKAELLTHRENDKSVRKKKKKARKKKDRKEVLLIKPNGEAKYSDILREIRTKANPDDTETIVKTVRQTRNGDVLLEFGKNSKDTEGFGKSLKNILGDKAMVVNLEPKISLELRDLDELTTAEEVEESIRKKVPTYITDIQVIVTGKNRSSLKMAILKINARAAYELLKTPTVKIGWIHCRIKQRVEVIRCYRCFGFGHQQANCTGMDRKGEKLCFTCGEKGHVRNTCKNPPRCYLCKDLKLPDIPLDHMPGSNKCQVFKTALEKTKKASSK